MKIMFHSFIDFIQDDICYKIVDGVIIEEMPNPYIFNKDIQEKLDSGEIKFVAVKRTFLKPSLQSS